MTTLRQYVFEECKRSIMTNFIAQCGEDISQNDDASNLTFEL